MLLLLSYYILHFAWESVVVVLRLLPLALGHFIDLGDQVGFFLRQVRIATSYFVQGALAATMFAGLFGLVFLAIELADGINRRRLRVLRRIAPATYEEVSGSFAAGAMLVTGLWLWVALGLFLLVHAIVSYLVDNWLATTFVGMLSATSFVYGFAVFRCRTLGRFEYEWFRKGMQPYYVIVPLLLLAAAAVFHTAGVVNVTITEWVIGEYIRGEDRAVYDGWLTITGNVHWLWDLDLRPILLGSLWAGVAAWLTAELATPALRGDWNRLVVTVCAFASPLLIEFLMTTTADSRDALADTISAPTVVVAVASAAVFGSILDWIRAHSDDAIVCTECEESIPPHFAFCPHCGTKSPVLVQRKRDSC